uniref:Reverse transcriptase zinc-binding domain-containing protein n=1 Tax=Setaria viridis TaxID=4556 RepID=A0A4U6TAT5_SETVI|nr:hypothetical protein SEVIR_8G017000v2 [Setaria viridis]
MKNITHLLFQCPVARCVWGIVAQCLGAHDIPSNLAQYWRWIKRCLPGGEGVYAFGLAAICWAIWKARNKACFERKLIKHPAEIITHACALMKSWTGLYKTDFQRR